MGTTEAQPWELQADVEDVADSASPARWTVEERAWKDLVPALPDEVIALVAPSVVVSAESVAVAPSADPAPAPASADPEPRARTLMPALPRRFRRRASR